MQEALNESVPRSIRPPSRYRQYNQYTGTRQDTTSYSSSSWTETRTGVQNPRWRDQVKSLSSATTAYTRSNHMKYTIGRHYLEVQVQHLYSHKVNDDRYVESQSHNYIFLPGNVVTSSKVYNMALGDFLTNINGALSPFKGGVFLGELRETLKMLRRPASALRDGFSAYLKSAHSMKRNWKKKTKLLNKALAGSWLEFAYGWKPLIADIEDAAKAYKAFDEKKITTFVKGEALDEVISTSLTGTYDRFSYLKSDFSDKTVGRDKIKMKGMVKHEFSGILPEQASRVIDLSGFRIEEFIPTVWELVPYSFVVDYFTNVGEILNSISALSANLAWKSCSRWTSTTRTVGYKADETRIRATFTPTQGSVGILSDGNPSVCERMNYSRTNPDLTIPGLVLHLPSKWQWVNLAALLGHKVS